MDNDFQKKKTDASGKNKPIGLILFSSLTLLLLFIGELYIMIIMQKEGLIEVLLIGVAILVFAYLDLSAVMKWIHLNEEEREEQYAGMLKAEKASYLLIRKYFDEIEEQLALMEDKVSDPFQEIVAAQKATAKVTINRNKENTDALMNSNDKLLDIIFGMESKIDELSGIVSGGTYGDSGDSKESNAELVQKQTEMADEIRDLGQNLKNEISQVVNRISSISSQVDTYSHQMMSMQQSLLAKPGLQDDLEVGDLEALGDLKDFATFEADVSADDLAGLAPDEGVAPLSAMESEPLSGLDPLFELEPSAEPGELSESLSELEPLSEPESTVEPEEMPEPFSELEPLSEPESAIEPEEMPEPLSELEPLSEPESAVGPEEMPEPLSELGTLSELEPVGGLEEMPESLSELEPMTEPLSEPEAEMPPMPDLSDLNRSMSPDEISALFANLG